MVSFERGKQLAESLGVEFFETSAKENINVRVRCLTLLSPGVTAYSAFRILFQLFLHIAPTNNKMYLLLIMFVFGVGNIKREQLQDQI